jgi:hypothetical protein
VIAPESSFMARDYGIDVTRRGRFSFHMRNFVAGIRRHTVRATPTHGFSSSSL